MPPRLAGYRKLFDDLKKGPPRPLYFLHGPEEFMKREFIRELIRAGLPDGDRTFNLDVIHGDEFDERGFEDRLRAFPLFSSRRIVVLRNFEGLSPSQRERVAERAAALPEGLTLVVESGQEKLETAAHRRLSEAAARGGVEHAFAALDASETMERVLGRLRREGCEIEPEALDQLVESVGTALIDLANEVDKIVLAAGPSQRITRDLVAAVVGKYRTESLFSLLDGLGASPPDSLLARLSRLIESGEEPVFIVSMLLRRVVSLLEVQCIVSERGRAVASDRSLAEAIAATPSPHVAGRLREQASRVPRAALETLLANLRWADLRLKTTALDARCVIEEALLASHVGKTLARPAAAS